MARIKPQALLLQSKKKKAPSRIGLTKILLFSLTVSLVLYCVFSSFRFFSNRSVSQGDQGYYSGRKGLGGLKEPGVPRYAILNTSKGMITVELLKDNSPDTVDEFIDLCEKGHFKGMHFHRVIKDFVIQAGDNDIHSLGATEDWTTRGKQYSGLEKSMKHEAFMLGTSKRKPGTKGFELYITTAPIPDLNEKLNVFGQVVKGVQVVQELEEVDTDEQYQPQLPISIHDVILEHTI